MMWPHDAPNPARIGTAIVLACLLAFAAPALAVASSKPHHHTDSKPSRTTTGPQPGPPTTPQKTTPQTTTPQTTTPETTTPYTPPVTTTPPAPDIEAPAPAPAPVAAPPTHKAATKHKPRPKKHHQHHHAKLAKLAAHKPKPKPPRPSKPAAQRASDSIVSQSANTMSLALIPLILLALAAALAATAIGTKIRSRRLAAADPEANAYEYDTPAQGFAALTPHAAHGERLRLYGERVRLALAARGTEITIVGVGLAAAVALGALVGGM
jgi:outer membrane biosynthesis protein TonB